MKLRIQGNSIRVRLTQGEVHRLGSDGSVEQTTTFSPLAKFCSRVESSLRVQKPSATFENQRLTLSLPSIEARQWAESDKVSIEAEQAVGDGTSLRLLIEKDFECVHPRDEDENIDAFPRPRAAASNS